jgi:galactokinase
LRTGRFAVSAAALFRSRFGADPVGTWSAPGRVNLIGEHTDYNGGLVLPFAIDSRAAVAIGPGGAAGFRITSAQRHAEVITAAQDELRPDATAARGWQSYPLGVLWSLREAGHDIPPLDLALDSAVPSGAGLSSSAAVECAVGLAVSEFLNLDLSPEAIARAAQRGENDFVGVPCGLMDQMAAAATTAGHALYFDVGADVVEQVPFDPEDQRLRALVINTRVHHTLADGEYAQRRAECETAARALGVEFLSQLGPVDLDRALGRLTDETLRRRVRHVVTENERVRRVVRLLRDGRLAEVGPELSASHASLRDDFQVSCLELDVAADAAERAGALGARMVGGGFGGSVIALVPADRMPEVEDAVTAAAARHEIARPSMRTVRPADGARRDGR